MPSVLSAPGFSYISRISVKHRRVEKYNCSIAHHVESVRASRGKDRRIFFTRFFKRSRVTTKNVGGVSNDRGRKERGYRRMIGPQPLTACGRSPCISAPTCQCVLGRWPDKFGAVSV